MKKNYSFFAFFGALTVLGISCIGNKVATNVNASATGKEVPLSNYDAWKFIGYPWSQDVSCYYVDSGVRAVVPGADTVGDQAWNRDAFIPQDDGILASFSLKDFDKFTFEVAVGFYDEGGNQISKSNNSSAIDIGFYLDANRSNQLGLLRIWSDSGSGLNGNHSFSVFTNSWDNVGNDKWIMGDATDASSFFVEFSKDRFISSYVAGSDEITALTGESVITERADVLKDVDKVYVKVEGDNGFTKATNITLKSINGQSLANDGINFQDNTAPQFKKAALSAEIPLNQEYTLPVEAVDLLSAVSYSVTIDGKTTVGKSFTPDHEGPLTVTLNATDAVGNTSSKDYNFTVVNNIEAPTFVSLPTIQGGTYKVLDKILIGMPEITDSTGSATVELLVHKDDELLYALSPVDNHFEILIENDFVEGDYVFSFNAKNDGGETKSSDITASFTLDRSDDVEFIGLPTNSSYARYTDLGIELASTLSPSSQWNSFNLGVFDLTQEFDFKFIADTSNTADTALGLIIQNVDDPTLKAEFRMWLGYSGDDRPTNVITYRESGVRDHTDAGWISRKVDGVDNKFHMAFSPEDMFVGERTGGMQQASNGNDDVKALINEAPSSNWYVRFAIGKDGVRWFKNTITEINGQSFARPITWNDAQLVIQSEIPENIALNDTLTIKAYAKDLRQECVIKLTGQDPENNPIDKTFNGRTLDYKFDKVGTYNLVISTVGSNGKTVEIKKTVAVKSSVEPITITVNGTYQTTYTTGTEITILSATYSQNVVSHKVTITEPGKSTPTEVEEGSKYTFVKPGIYKITYTAQDDALPSPNEKKEEFTINVPDAEKPVVTINAPSEANKGNEVSATITVEDASEVEVTVTLTKPDGTSTSLQGTNNVYKFTPDVDGKYVIKVVAEDVYGNRETKTHNVTVTTPSKGGCGGSVVTTSILLSSLSVIGVILVTNKKRKEK